VFYTNFYTFHMHIYLSFYTVTLYCILYFIFYHSLTACTASLYQQNPAFIH
jgi:hypothetical protein